MSWWGLFDIASYRYSQGKNKYKPKEQSEEWNNNKPLLPWNKNKQLKGEQQKYFAQKSNNYVLAKNLLFVGGKNYIMLGGFKESKTYDSNLPLLGNKGLDGLPSAVLSRFGKKKDPE